MQVLLLLLLLVVWSWGERVHYCECVNVSRLNPETNEHETWCLPVLASLEKSRALYKDEVSPTAYVDGGFLPVVVGGQVGSYSVLSKLGNGGFATVWEAQSANGMRVALKITRSDSTRLATDEIQALKEIGPHPNIVPLLDEFQVESAFGTHQAVAMGLVQGKDLLKLKESSGVAEARIVARDITKALAHAHASGWAHTDIVREERKKVFFFCCWLKDKVEAGKHHAARRKGDSDGLWRRVSQELETAFSRVAKPRISSSGDDFARSQLG
jgi:hypothetical protein